MHEPSRIKHLSLSLAIGMAALLLMACANTRDGLQQTTESSDTGQAVRSEVGRVAYDNAPSIDMVWGGFIIIDGKIAYKLDYELELLTDREYRIVFQCENPIAEGEPIVFEVSTASGESEISVTSQALDGIRNDASYRVDASLYHGNSELASASDQVHFHVAPAMLEKLGITLID